jgi:FHA domain-containing protein
MSTMTISLADTNGSSVDSDVLLAAFLRGAGLQDVAINWQMTPEFMELVGTLLATSVDGAVTLLAARARLKSDVNADKTMVVVRNNNPLKFLPHGQAALTQMLRKKMPGFMGPAEALQDAFEDLATHHECVIAGMHGAAAGAVAKLDPDVVASDTRNGGVLDRMVPGRRKAALWDRYCALHVATQHAVDTSFESTLGAAFAAAYEQRQDQLQELPDHD